MKYIPKQYSSIFIDTRVHFLQLVRLQGNIYPVVLSIICFIRAISWLWVRPSTTYMQLQYCNYTHFHFNNMAIAYIYNTITNESSYVDLMIQQ